jgi:hypothetical protein
MTETLLAYVAEALAREAGSKAFRETGTAWQHAQDAWLAHANAAINAVERWELRTKTPAASPTPPTLRDLYAAAIASYDHAVGQATDPAPTGHHHGQADAVLAVRDAELERVRADRDRWRQRAEKRAARYEEIEAAEQRVRAQLDDLCREPHPSHDHVCPDDVRRYILRALDEPPATA